MNRRTVPRPMDTERMRRRRARRQSESDRFIYFPRGVWDVIPDELFPVDPSATVALQSGVHIYTPPADVSAAPSVEFFINGESYVPGKDYPWHRLDADGKLR